MFGKRRQNLEAAVDVVRDATKLEKNEIRPFYQALLARGAVGLLQEAGVNVDLLGHEQRERLLMILRLGISDTSG